MQAVESLFPDLVPAYTTRVYFGLGQSGQVKIGLTSRPSGHRGGEMHFTELCSAQGNRITEAHYHHKYAAERIGRTEWFHLSDRLLMDLITMCVGQHRTQSTEILKTIIYGRLQERRAA